MPGKFELNEADDNTWTFDLKSANGEVIASSQVYQSRDDALTGILAVIATVPDAEVPPDIQQTMLHMH